ncbi:hypothetical protein CHS0354_039275 [Potamilus streckersoni]|uniref:Insulin-like domain-containing protein n=1 Tax=Potamilus streckersoni TaxID=2493646 RepID=A0AAE0RMM5_9BIVA|nr:hypothetical protein CHS0354_039275 [Potamilus streckersoni]
MQNETLTLLVLCFVTIEFRSMFASIERTCSPLTINRGPDPRGICGRKMDETVKLLCGTFGYNAKSKRDTFQYKGTDFLSLQRFLIGKEEAHSYLVKRSNFYQQGIACECCYHKCRIAEILQHCL